jgi:glycosyltransferase involved in cell wall biosynthesis
MPNEHQNLLSRLKHVENKFIIGYAGGMGEANALDYLLAAAKLVADQPIALVLVGDGPNKQSMIERVVNEKLNNVYFMPSIGKLEIPSFLQACDALYIGWNKLPIYRFGICPNKLFDYMLAKKPVIHSVTAGNDLVNEANCGISVAAEDVEAIASAMTTLIKLSKPNLAALAQNGYNFVLRNHDYRVLATRFLDLLEN